MSLPWELTDQDAKNIYNAMSRHYGKQQMPTALKDYTGVFYGYSNFTRDKLWYCIEYLKKNYSKGWFTEDSAKRKAALTALAKDLYDIFLGAVDVDGIYKFLVWIYSFAKQNADAVKYFGGGNYTLLDNMAATAKQTIVEPVKQTAENVSYAVSIPSLKTLLPDNMTLLKWGVIIGVGMYLWKFLENQTKRI